MFYDSAISHTYFFYETTTRIQHFGETTLVAKKRSNQLSENQGKVIFGEMAQLCDTAPF